MIRRSTVKTPTKRKGQGGWEGNSWRNVKHGCDCHLVCSGCIYHFLLSSIKDELISKIVESNEWYSNSRYSIDFELSYKFCLTDFPLPEIKKMFKKKKGQGWNSSDRVTNLFDFEREICRVDHLTWSSFSWLWPMLSVTVIVDDIQCVLPSVSFWSAWCDVQYQVLMKVLLKLIINTYKWFNQNITHV